VAVASEIRGAERRGSSATRPLDDNGSDTSEVA
jgi:hypothetical protein